MAESAAAQDSLQLIVFRSGEYHFALAASVVREVSMNSSQTLYSFGRLILGITETECCSLKLTDDVSFSTGELIEGASDDASSILPVPNYIFMSHHDWLSGMLISSGKPVFKLNERTLIDILKTR